jgi:uncharacterized RDD family membrane protein YckC
MVAPIITPEAVALYIEPAGLGSRMIAALIDTSIQLVILIAASILIGFAAAAGLGGEVAIILALVLFFFVMFGYFPLFEGIWEGRTPGKRTQRLRVVQKNGQPARFTHVLVRNLVRVIDFLPVGYSVGALTMIITKTQRLGDLAAGTIVVKEVKAPLPSPFQKSPEETNPAAGSLDVSAITDREFLLIRSFLERRDELIPGARTELSRKLASDLRERVPGNERIPSDEDFLTAVASIIRSRSG